ncbi:MAG: TIR domain-containing protein, partial [Phycisphaerae bacterium]
MYGPQGSNWNEPKDIFVSYAHADDPAIVKLLVDQIEAAFRLVRPDFPLEICFFDKQSIPNASHWEDEIRDGLRASKMLIALISADYLRRDETDRPNWCRREWDEFVQLERARLFHTGPADYGWPQRAIVPIFIAPPSELAGQIDDERRAWWEDIQRRQGIELHENWPLTVATKSAPEPQPWLTKLVQDLADRAAFGRKLAAVPRTAISHNPNFVGRDEELRKIHQHLIDPNDGVACVCAVNGVGGIGKTSVAREYAWRYRPYYLGGQFEVRMAQVTTLEGLQGKILALARGYLQASIPDNLPLDTQFELAIAAFNNLPSDKTALLILDNLNEEDAALLSKTNRNLVLPSPERVHTVITTRSGAATLGDMPRIRVDRLTPSEALDVILRYRPIPLDSSDPDLQRLRAREVDSFDDVESTEWKAAIAIANRLGRHTMVVALTGAFLGHVRKNMSCLEFLREMDQLGLGAALSEIGDPKRMQGLIDHPHTMVTVLFADSLDWLRKTSPLAWPILELAALLPPDVVPLQWIAEVLRDDDALAPHLSKSGFGAQPFADAVAELRALEYFTGPEDAPTVQIHRVVQEVIRGRIDTQRASQLQEALVGRAAQRANLLEGKAVSPERLQQIYALSEAGEYWRDGSVTVAKLMGQVAGNLLSIGDVARATRMYESSHQDIVALQKAKPDDNSSARLLSVSLEKLGDLAVRTGKPEDAARYFGESHKILERLAQALPNDVGAQRDLSVSLNKLGDLAVRTGKPEDAARYFGESHKILERLAQALPNDVGAQRD